MSTKPSLKKQTKQKLISAENKKGIVYFKAEFNGKEMEDRCSLAGIQNIVKEDVDHPLKEIYKLVINSIGESNAKTSDNY